MAISGMGQVASHQAEGAAVEGRNRAKLKNFDRANKQYRDEIMFDQVQYENDQIDADIAYDNTYQNMVDQFAEQDVALDKLFAEGDQKLESAIIDMYESDYAGTQTGRTAMRLAGRSAKKLGQYKSHLIHTMMMAETDVSRAKDTIGRKAESDARAIYNKVRFAPSVGPTPQAPELEAKPSSAGLILGLAGTAVQGFKDYKSFKGKNKGLKGNKKITSRSAEAYNRSNYYDHGSGISYDQHWAGINELGNK